MDRLYYDGRCPICVREAQILERLNRGTLELLDLHAYPETPGTPSRLLMQTTLHLQTAEGTWLTGLDANVRAWSHTRWGLPWQVLRLPLIRQVADLSYNSWAQRRYRRLYGCADCGPAN